MAYQIELLGGLRIRRGNTDVHRLQTRQAGALLAYLALYPERAHSRERLAGMLWPDADGEAARQNLRQALFSLRRQLESAHGADPPLIAADRTGLRINSAAVGTDVFEFRREPRRAGLAPHPLEKQRLLLEGLGRYGGELLPGLDSDWVLSERRVLEEEFVRAARDAAECSRETGLPEAVLDALHRAANIDPCREEIHFELLRALQACGRPSQALTCYTVFERNLREFGAAPSSRLRELRQQLLQDLRTGTRIRPTASELQRTGSAPLPRGTHTLVLLRVRTEGNWKELQARCRERLAEFGGIGIIDSGAALCRAFPRATEAHAACIACWQLVPEQSSLSAVLHTAEFGEPPDETGGQAVTEAAAMMEAAHWAQWVCSGATAALLEPALVCGALSRLGEFRLRRGGNGLRVYQVHHPALPQESFPPLAAERVSALSLPPSPNGFFGREAEMERLSTVIAVGETRLVTLTGPGGCGKTRLILEVAREFAPGFPGAFWFVPLADLSDPSGIPSAILTVMGVLPRPFVDPLMQVIEALGGERGIIVLDNLEHLIGEDSTGDRSAVGVVAELVAGCANVTCVVTSRRKLGLDLEQEITVGPLPVPMTKAGFADLNEIRGNPSVRLLTERAQAVRPDFQVTERNSEAVARLCGELEGIPLAIELAAARAAVLTPEQMLHELRRRFSFLASRRREIPERHRTAWATIDWSYRLLPDDLKQFFVALSVFRGGWTLDAAAAAAVEPRALDFLEDLRCASLIQTCDGVGAGVRFRMLETLREFAWEVSTACERSQRQQKHAAYYLDLARWADLRRRESNETAIAERILVEHQNFRSALEYLLTTAVEEALELVIHLSWFWEGSGHVPHALDALRKALEEPVTANEPLVARGYCAVGRLCFWQGDLPAARQALEESLVRAERLRLGEVVAEALSRLGMVTIYQGDYGSGRSLLEHALRVCDTQSTESGRALALLQLGILGNCICDWQLSSESLEACMVSARSQGDRRTEGLALFFLGDAALSRAEFQKARPLLDESRVVGTEANDETVLTHALWGLAIIEVELRELVLARATLRELVPLGRKLGNWTHPFILEAYGYLAAASGDCGAGARLLGCAAGTRRRSSMPLTASYDSRHNRFLDSIRRQLSASQFDRAWAEGEATAPELAIERARNAS